MQDRTFYISLGILTAVVYGLLYLTHTIPAMSAYSGFSVVGLGVIVVYNILAYSMARILIKSRKSYVFINFIIANILVKMALVMFYILGYVSIYPPKVKFFIIPFVGIYLVYTVFETYFLYHMVNLKQSRDEQI